MWVFALLAAGFGTSAETESKDKDVMAVTPEVTREAGLRAPPSATENHHFFEPHFAKSPHTRGFMVITPRPQVTAQAEGQDVSPWLEPPEGWVAPDLKSKPFRVEPLKKLEPTRFGQRKGG